jgi:hypothetical protein
MRAITVIVVIIVTVIPAVAVDIPALGRASGPKRKRSLGSNSI